MAMMAARTSANNPMASMSLENKPARAVFAELLAYRNGRGGGG